MRERTFTDTSNIFSIDNGDKIAFEGMEFRVTGHERESRFGLEEPKFWVKKAIDLKTGEKKILKLSYFETFETKLGGVRIKRFRSPEKEGNILKLIGGHPHFMHGQAFYDDHNNNIRVIEIVKGENFFIYIGSLEISYEKYFQEILPDLLKRLIPAMEAIFFLHANGFKHGDIRNDHLIIEKNTGNFVWIDFDYDYETTENPFSLDIFGLGNLLIYAIGKGFHTNYTIKNDPKFYKNIYNDLKGDDFSLLDKYRFINLRKIYPVIPKILNDIVMHFSVGSNIYYEYVDEIIEDLSRCIYTIFD